MKISTKRVIGLISASCAVLLLASNLLAAEFPNMPIKFIVGFKAGGAVDTMSRILAEEMSKDLGQPVVVQNKAGGGGNLATNFVKNSDADGYTISAIPSELLVSDPILLKTNYTESDFAYLGAGAMFQEAFVASADKPYNDFKGMIEWAKKNGKTLRYASMIPTDIAVTKAISKETGVKILPVPTKGGAAVMTSVLGGYVDFGFSGGLHYSYVKAGKMKVLMSAMSKRLAAFPDIPTSGELGWDLPLDNYMMVFLRKEVPQDIQQKLAQAIEKAFKSKKFLLVAEKLNLVPVYFSPKQCESQIEKTKKVMEKFDF